MKTRLTAAIAGGVLAGALAIGAVAILGKDGTSTTSAAPNPQPTGVAINKTITVSGEGKIVVKPDTASVSLGVSVDADSAAAALKQANDKADALIKAIKAAGVADDDIVTSGLSVYPRYDNGNNKVSGYTASNNVTVTVRNIAKAGPVIDAAAAAAGDNVTIGGISFYVDDTEKLIGAARADAIANAKKRAGEFAAAAGAKVGGVLQISEVGVSIPQPIYRTMEAADSAGGATPIQTGTQDLTVSVTVVYELA